MTSVVASPTVETALILLNATDAQVSRSYALPQPFRRAVRDAVPTAELAVMIHAECKTPLVQTRTKSPAARSDLAP